MKQQTQNLLYPSKKILLRTVGNLSVLLLILVLGFLILTIKNDWINKEIEHIKQCFFDYTYSRGFALQKVNISGLVRQDKNDLMTVLNLTGEDNVLEINVAQLKQNIQNLIWVENVEVNKTFFPNELNIKIKERDVLAVWQNDGKFWPVDTNANVVKDKNYIPSKFDLVIAGMKAPENLLEFMKIITKDNEVFNKIVALNFVSERRWNVVFDEQSNSIVLKLPAEDVENAWNKFLKLHKTEGILKRKLTIVDLRLADRVVVKVRKNNKQPKK